MPGNMNKGGFKIIYNSEKLEITHLSAGEQINCDMLVARFITQQLT